MSTRLSLRLLLSALLCGFLAPAGWLVGQDPPAKTPQPQRQEEEDPNTKPAPGQPGDTPEKNLVLAARRPGTHFAINKLFQDLAVPHDVVTFRSSADVRQGERVEDVDLLSEYYGDDVQTQRGEVKVTPLDLAKAGKAGTSYKRPLTSVRSVRPYERVAVDEVKAFLDEHYERNPPEDRRRYLSRHDQLVAAEQALDWAWNNHLSALATGKRNGAEAWKPVGETLRRYLLDVRIAQLNNLAQTSDWDRAYLLTRRLAELYKNPDEQALIAGPLTDLLRKALAGTDLSEDRLRDARRRLRRLYEDFPDSPVVVPIADALKQQGKALLEAAKGLVKDPKKAGEDAATLARCLDLLKQAEETWPELPGLRAYRIELTQVHPILKVAVRELPRYLSPTKATTDTERRAVEMLFEGLVKLSPDESGVMRYRPALAEGRPRVVPLGRQFQLPRNGTFSNGQALTAADVRYSFRQLREGGLQREGGQQREGVPMGLPRAYAELLDNVDVGADSYQVTLTLRQGCLDPLVLATFKVVPDGTGVEREEFARRPVGSGPFTYEGTRSEGGREYAAFVANPSYGIRAGKSGLPHIQEIRLFQSSKPVEDLDKGAVKMALDLKATDVMELRKNPAKYHLLLPGPQVCNRRIYFLAVNHRKPILANPDVRRALNYAIDRDKILDTVYRGGLGRQVHKALNGPFPAGSWACSPKVAGRGEGSLDPYNPELAKALRGKDTVKRVLAGAQLTLKYPGGDPDLEKAMTLLRDQVKAGMDLTLELQKTDPQQLRIDVEETGSFELAYYSYDFPDQTYWLWPLLGPGKGSNGNFLGFNHPLIDAALRESTGHRDFARVQKSMQEMHEVLAQEVPLVPLWQLDPLLAWTKAVHPTPLDPLSVFTEVERWRLDAE
jgi:peptide/nickel transport system substrate-binding protein